MDPLLATALLGAAGVGVVLGLLGGGGSILLVPLLVYGIGLDARTAIPTSLLAVAVTSAVALVPHARAGRVRWRTGAAFGTAGMAGAFAGGRLAGLVPGPLLLLGFAALMAGAGVAMLRGGTRPTGSGMLGGGSAGAARPARPALRFVLDGLAVGSVTGLVGAGGGFLVVPALALLGGLAMPAAVGTSLLVLALQATAGFAGHAGHAGLDWTVTGGVVAATAAGSLAGARAVALVSPERLRRGFGVLVLGLAGFMGVREAPALAGAGAWLTDPDAPRLLLHGLAPLRWPVAGVLLGAVTLLLLGLANRRLGISTSFDDLCVRLVRMPASVRAEAAAGGWRLQFVAGLVAGGALSAWLGGGWRPFWDAGRLDAAFALGPAAKLAWMFAGGLLIGFGTRLAGGCTSGHGIFGVSHGERAGLAATLAYMAAGVAVSHAVYRLAGA